MVCGHSKACLVSAKAWNFLMSLLLNNYALPLQPTTPQKKSCCSTQLITKDYIQLRWSTRLNIQTLGKMCYKFQT